MVAPAQVGLSPLGSLRPDEREEVIVAITERLPRADAARLLTALAGTRDEVAAVSLSIQEAAQRAILATLPAGRSAIVVSTLGVPTKTDLDYLEEVLTEEEKADPAFRQQVEEESSRRRIPRWLAASRLRWNRMGLDPLVASLQHQHGDFPADRDVSGDWAEEATRDRE